MKTISTIYSSHDLTTVSVRDTHTEEPKARYYIYADVYQPTDFHEADLTVYHHISSNGDHENCTDLPDPKQTWPETRNWILTCNKLVVNKGKIAHLHTDEKSNMILVIKDNGIAYLVGGNRVIIESESNDSLKITLVTHLFEGSTIKNTNHLLEFAQSVLNLYKDLPYIGYKDYGLARQIKKISNMYGCLEVNPYKLTLHSEELKNKTHEIEREVNENFYEFYALGKQSGALEVLTPDIMGQIGSYLQGGDVIL